MKDQASFIARVLCEGHFEFLIRARARGKLRGLRERGLELTF